MRIEVSSGGTWFCIRYREERIDYHWGFDGGCQRGHAASSYSGSLIFSPFTVPGLSETIAGGTILLQGVSTVVPR